MPLSDEFEKLLKSWKQMDVDRKLREELRMDSQRLHEEFREEYRKRRKRPYGESHPYNAFIPKRFEDLKLNGGTRFKRITIKQNYHRSRFKDLNSKPPRRALDFKGSLDLTGLATSQRRRVRMKTIGMKKQYNREKKGILLAQACKSLGVFCESSGCKDTKNDLQIRVGTRQIVDTGVKRDEHHFGDGFTSYAPMDIECQVDTLIGVQSIFAEEVKVRDAADPDAADPDAAMESLQVVTSMESVSEELSKHKNRIKLSQVQQKWGKRGFHKVRFKGGHHLRRALYTGRVVRQKKISHKTRKKVWKIIVLLARHGPSSFRLTRSGKMWLWWLMKTLLRKQLIKLNLTNQVWEPGIICYGIKNKKLKSDCKFLGFRVHKVRHKLFPLVRNASVRGVCKREVMVQLVQYDVRDKTDSRVKIGKWWIAEKMGSVKDAMALAFVPGGASGEKAQVLAVYEFLSWKHHKPKSEVVTLNRGKKVTITLIKARTEVIGELVWEPGGSAVDDRLRKLIQRVHKSSFYRDSREFAQIQKTQSLSVVSELFRDSNGTIHSRAKSEEFKWMIRRQTLKRFGVIGLRECVEILVNQPSLRMETWDKESNSGQAKCLKGVNSYREGDGAGNQYPNIDGNRVWNPGALVVEEDKSYSSVIAEMLWIAEYRRISVMDVHTNSENEVKWVVVLSVTRTLDSQKSLSSYEYVITGPAFGLWSLEDKAVIRPGSTLKFYGEKIVKQQQRCNTPLLPSVFTHGTFQSPRPPESLFSYCRKMASDMERLENVEVTRNYTERDGCSWWAWNNDRREGNSYLKINGLQKLIVAESIVCDLVTFWPVFEFLLAVLEANFMALINTKGVRVTGCQMCDLFDVSRAIKVAITSLSILKMQVILRWTFNIISNWFQSPRPPELMTGLIENHGNGALVITASKVRQLEDKLAPALHQLEDKLVLHRGSIDKHIDGPRLSLMGH